MAKFSGVKARQSGCFPALTARSLFPTILLIALFWSIGHPEIVAAQLAEINPRISKDDGGITANPGGLVVYTLSYENTGLNDASGVTLTETVPANTTFSPGASTAGWVCVPDNNAGSTCTLAVGFLAGNGRLASSLFAVTIDNPVPFNLPLISNTATISADQDDDPTDNVASDTTPLNPLADLSIVQSDAPDPVLQGGQLTYTITVANAGQLDAQAVAVTDLLPAGVTALATTGCAEDPNGLPTCTLGTVAAGASAHFTVSVRVDSGATGTLTNTASVSSGTIDPDLTNNSSSGTTEISQAVPTMTAWGTAILIVLIGIASLRSLRTGRPPVR